MNKPVKGIAHLIILLFLVNILNTAAYSQQSSGKLPALPVMIAPAATLIWVACGASPVKNSIPYSNGLNGESLVSGTSDLSTFTTMDGSCGGTLTETFTATDTYGRQLAPVSRTVTVSQNLGTVQKFIFFSGNGVVSNTGSSIIKGDIGSNVGAVSGFDAPSIIEGDLYNAGTSNALQASTDLLNLYIHLSNVPTTNTSHAPVFGSGETLTAGVYSIAGAASLAGNLILDGMGNKDTIIILKFSGAFSPAAGSSVTLINGMKACNVFWIAEGAISIGANSLGIGTYLAHTGAVTMAAGGGLVGRLLSTTGAVTFGPGLAELPSGNSNIPIICINTCSSTILGSASSFTLFSGAGAVSNTATSAIIGNVGTCGGAITGFDASTSSTLIGNTYSANSVTLQVSKDLQSAYSQLIDLTVTNTHAPVLGSGETLFPGVYAMAGAGSLAGTIILDAKGDPNAQFIFRFGGAFSVAAQSSVILKNKASNCNVFWISEGALSIGTFGFMKGYFIAHAGAASMGANGNLQGSLFSTAGSVSMNTGVAYINYSLCGNDVIPLLSASNPFSIEKIAMLVRKDVLVYPNPTKGLVHIDLGGNTPYNFSVQVFDIMGRIVYSSNQYTPEIDLSANSVGIYTVRVHLNAKTITTKVVIEK